MQKLGLYIAVTIDMIKALPNVFHVRVLTLEKKMTEAEDVETFIFSDELKVPHKAGQYGFWGLKQFVLGKPVRFFTIAAPEEDAARISTHISSQTPFKKKLSSMKPGDKAWMIGPFGNFVLDTPAPKNIVLLAGGIGITPMRAIAKDIYDNKKPVHTTLLHSANGAYVYRDEMETYADETHFVTRDTFETTLNSVIEQHDKDTVYYISGPPAFVIASKDTLRKKRIKHVKLDGFLGYK